VAELTGTIKRLLEKEVGEVWVTGEVTNLRAQASGHVYFSVKDATAQLGCVLFRAAAAAGRAHLRDGAKVLLRGDLTVYEPRGQYQMVVKAVEPQGVGALQLAYEQLKRRLEAEGLFAQERKRPLPRYPQRIGVATSPTGAALQDVLHVIERRQPGLEIVVAPCRVQGDGAAAEVAEAVRLLNRWSAAQPPGAGLDLILVTRGGGSLEDLWAFNEEAVARAIFESVLPVVSAVGHEIDFTISDFVADLRAATPSAAAEVITEGSFASRQSVAMAARRLWQRMRDRVEREGEAVAGLRRRLERAQPRRWLDERWQHLDDLTASLLREARRTVQARRTTWAGLRDRMLRVRPSAVVAERRRALGDLRRELTQATRASLKERQARLELLRARLQLLSPQSVLARGYSITLDAQTGRVVRSAAETQPGRRLRTRLAEGEVGSVVEG
jgi:exodeoxyribonuclease VII large subunit